jgi:LacI family transcriptional regulator
VQDLADWRRMQETQCLDGVLAVEGLPETVLAELEASDYPAVLLNLATRRALHQILPDDRGGAAAAVAHLAALGHRCAVYVPRTASFAHASDDERWAGARMAAAAAGLALERGDLAAALRRCAADATALIAYSQVEAVAALAGLRESGRAVPRQVSVVSCSDVPWLAHIHPAVTAVAIPMAEMARRAAGLVVDLVERSDAPAPRAAVVAERLVPRASTAPPGGRGSETA